MLHIKAAGLFISAGLFRILGRAVVPGVRIRFLSCWSLSVPIIRAFWRHPNPVPPMTSPIHLAYSLLDRCPSLRQIVRKLCFWRWSEAFVHGAYNLTRSSWLWALCLDRYPNLVLGSDRRSTAAQAAGDGAEKTENHVCRSGA